MDDKNFEETFRQCVSQLTREEKLLLLHRLEALDLDNERSKTKTA